MTEEQLAEEIKKCRLAKTNASPVIKGMISKRENMKNGSEENLVCDSGCSFPVVSEKIVSRLGIRIRPFSSNFKIVEGGGKKSKSWKLN